MGNGRRSGESIIRRIKAAFEDVPYPGNQSIVNEDDGDQVERRAVRTVYEGRSWQQIANDADILRNSGAVAALGFMTPQAFRYYLPAFMKLTVEHYKRTDIDPDSVAFYIGEHASKVGFNIQQWEAIKDFLEFIREREHVDRTRIDSSLEVARRECAAKKSAS